MSIRVRPPAAYTLTDAAVALDDPLFELGDVKLLDRLGLHRQRDGAAVAAAVVDLAVLGAALGLGALEGRSLVLRRECGAVEAAHWLAGS